MMYQISVNGRGKAISCVKGAGMQNGEIHYSVVDKSAFIAVDADDVETAIQKAEQLYERYIGVKNEKGR